MAGLFYITLGIIFVILPLQLLSKRPRYPPGPSGLPIIGNTLQIPFDKPWKYFERLHKKYGDIVQLSLGGDNVLILSHPDDAEELLGKRSFNYSSRKMQVYVGKYQSNGNRFVLLPYNAKFKKHRSVYTQVLHPRVLVTYEPFQIAESIRLLYDSLIRPREWIKNSKRFSASLIYRLTYGRPFGEDDDDLNELLEITERSLKDGYPGAHLVDIFPVLDVLPNFLAPWRARAKAAHDVELRLFSKLALEVKHRMDSGEALDCLTAHLWKKQKEMDLDLEELSYIAGQGMEAGSDTTSSTMQWFFIAMALHPECMKKAQIEIDSVVGSEGDSMPGFEHIDRLPYCVALMKEVMRWNPTVATGFPHVSEADDEYKGYKASRTMVIACIWTLHHNENVYPDPYTFSPERFIEQAQNESIQSSTLSDGHYGYGKCPGHYLASKSLWIAMARMLWAFDIKPESNSHGKPVRIDPEACHFGVTTSPFYTPLDLIPRSGRHAELVRSEYAACWIEG
ncbi:cytochrome P450 [Hysterangium stoloniferum]|nr:cytochrome P450 [Hysterangium stoloniferum]